MIRQLCLSLALLCICTSTVAAPWYFGGGFGNVDYDADYVSSFNNPVGIELIIGNSISRNFSFEASYIDFGEANDHIPPNWRLSATGLTVGALFKAPVGMNLDLLFKLGLNSWDGEIKEDGYGIIDTNDGTDMFYGIGAEIHTYNNIRIGARYNTYDFNGDDVTMFSINLFVGI